LGSIAAIAVCQQPAGGDLALVGVHHGDVRWVFRGAGPEVLEGHCSYAALTPG